MSNQASLFDIPDYDEPVEPDDIDRKPIELGDSWCNSHYKYIELNTYCECCKRKQQFRHYQILTDDQMRAKGWIEKEPFVWYASFKSCSRSCQNTVLE